MCEFHNFKDSGSREKNDWILDLEENFNFEALGKEYKINKELEGKDGLLHFMSIQSFRVINLYKYEPQRFMAPIIENSRRFCRQLYLQTAAKDNYMTFSEVQSLSNPGRSYGVNDVLFYAGNYSRDKKYATCRHRWKKFLYDEQTGNIIEAPNQPRYQIRI